MKEDNQREAMGNTVSVGNVAGSNPALSVKLLKEMKRHKKIILMVSNGLLSGSYNKENKEFGNLMNLLNSQARNISLVISDFKCRKCGTEENLTIHHLITRDLEDFMPLNFYISQRHYWANLLVLCTDCHTKLHKKVNKMSYPKDEMGIIKKELIEKLRKKYK